MDKAPMKIVLNWCCNSSK